ncbi:MAG: ATP synthase F1 subunit epsilon [Acidobacteria bacterium]|nr:ATP synthase F1 subunit epsilon [Acidobacteriota bacterium]
MATFRLEIATPERPILDEQVSDAQIPASNGYLGLLPQHAPLIADLSAGLLSYTTGGKSESLFITDGWVEVLNDRVRVLADAVENPTEIDVIRAQKALDRALERLRIDVSDVDKARAVKAQKRAEARLTAAKNRT